MIDAFETFRRIEVKAALAHEGWIWFGAADGLYRKRSDDDACAAPVEGWRGEEVQALAPDGDRLLVCAYDGRRATLDRLDPAGRRTPGPTPPEGEKVKAVCCEGGALWIGTKRGVFRRDGDGWRHVFDGDGKAEIIRLWHDGATLAASVKKLAPHDRPALIDSADGGETWRIAPRADYQDLIVAVAADVVVTKWSGVGPRSGGPARGLRPVTAAAIGADGAVTAVSGDRLETTPPTMGPPPLRHPVLGDAEHLLRMGDDVVVAGAQGAWLFKGQGGEPVDLLPHASPGAPYGKIKRLFACGDALVATTTFGAFRSTDGGDGWTRCAADWRVLDAEHAVQAPGDRWWIGCQRALFRTDDRGARITHHPIRADGPHFAELRSLAVAGDRVCVGSKQGLLVNGADDDPERFRRVAWFGTTSIESLLWVEAEGALLVGAGDGALHRWDMTGAPTLLASLPIDEATLVSGDARCWIESAGRIVEIAGGDLNDVTPPQARGGVRLRDFGQRLLCWDAGAAWLREKNGSGWRIVARWPADVRDAALDASRDRIVTTDRARLAFISL